MKYIIDSSTAFQWFVREADTDKALRLRDDFRTGVHDLVAPDVYPAEMTHALTRAERQGRIEVRESLRLIWSTCCGFFRISIDRFRCFRAPPRYPRKPEWESMIVSTWLWPSGNNANW